MSTSPAADRSPGAPPSPNAEGTIFDLDTFAVHDGPGIRMTVYLKGCPLSCAWCHSPESRAAAPELILARDRCVLCGACVAACPEGAHRLEDGRHVVDRARCRVCGACVLACPQGALQIKGYRVTAREIVRRAGRLRPFFEHSGGGVTLTGGEVTMQPDFAEAVLRGCREAGIHTAIETSGACTWPVLRRLVEHTDLVLYDLKLHDDQAHRRWVGASNRQTLDNAVRLANTGAHVQVRVPLIPGITDTQENLRDTFRFMRDAGLWNVALLPYNESAPAKYEWLDEPYTVTGERQPPAALAAILAMARDHGLDARVDG
ncbi:MAG: glycyl-radical enzyme activating protein [Chloroflexi bacterium]|nr:glycyl-radical enzyme activating protein [Chloroflexota bacterium]